MPPCPDELVTQHYLGQGFGHGPVRDDEVVLSAVFENSKRSGKRLEHRAFASKDLNRGEVSLARASFTTRDTFTRCIIAPLTPSQGEFIGAAEAAVNKLRGIVYRLEDAKPPVEGRAICILDKVTELDFDSHAAIAYSATHGNLSQNQKSKVRPFISEDIAEAFGEAMSLEQVLPGHDLA